VDLSILNSTKKVLGISEEYTAFDQDILTHINAAFATLNQLGVGPVEGFFLEDSDPEWSAFTTDLTMTNLVKSYVYLKVRILFDPPTTSFVLDAQKQQLEQFEWRLSTLREWYLDPIDPRA